MRNTLKKRREEIQNTQNCCHSLPNDTRSASNVGFNWRNLGLIKFFIYPASSMHLSLQFA
jgi:hypothetical protein